MSGAEGARSVRATSFGAVAADYDRYRPGPPAVALEWILPDPVGMAVDLGAGTGALTRLLAMRAEGVVAVEADGRMAAVLRRRGGSRVAVGRGEALPLADASADAVLVASAWHWMDEARTVPEIARVLRPGGVFGVLWSGPDRSVPWVAEVATGGAAARAARSAGTGSTEGTAGTGDGASTGGDGAGEARHRQVTLPPGAPFGPPEQVLLRWSRPYATADLPGLAGTYSTVITSSDEERAALAAAVADAVAATPETAGRDQVELPMRVLCWRAVRD